MAEARIAPLEAATEPAVLRFLEAHPDATLFHRPVWHRVIEAAYGHRCHYWVAREGEEVRGVFPVVRVHHPLLGTKHVAMAYQLYSGLPLSTDEPTARSLVARALESALEDDALWVEIRHWAPAPWLEELGFSWVDSRLSTTHTPLAGLSPSQMRKGHRKDIKEARNRGVVVRRATAEEEVRAWRRLYLDESRAKGSPQAGWRWFEAMMRLAPDHWKLLVAHHEGRLLGGTFTVGDDKVFFGRCAAYGTPEARALRVGKALYWQELQDARDRGCWCFNLGVSFVGDAGLVRSKEGWNGVTRPVHLYVLPLRKAPKPPGDYFDGFSLAKTVWRRLPRAFADRLGHSVTRWVS